MAAPMKSSILGVCRFLVYFTPIRRSSCKMRTTCNNANEKSLLCRYFSPSKSFKNLRNVGYSRAKLFTLTTRNRIRKPFPDQAQWKWDFVRRWMVTELTDEMLRKEMDKLTDHFMEAKELLDDARESRGSVYFNEDLEDADKAVKETLTNYQSLLSQLDDVQRQNVTRTIGLRMEELSAQQKMIRESLKE